MGTVTGNMGMTHDGNVVKPGTPAGGSNVGFQVDREHIPDVIKELERALDALSSAGEMAQNLRRITPPGGDPHSAEAVRAMGPELVGKYMETNRRDITNIRAMIENLKAAMQQYDAQEDESSRALQKRV